MALRLATIGVLLTLAGSAAAPQGDVPVTSVTVQLVRKPVDVLFVSLQNMRDVPLVAWGVRVSFGPSRATTTNSDFLASLAPWPPGTGPIEPREIRRIRLSSEGSPVAAVTTVTLAVYADGVTEGTQADIAAFLTRTRAWADDLAFWQHAFEEMPRSEDAGLSFLVNRAADSKRVRPDDLSQITSDVLRWAVTPPPGWAFFDGIERLKAEATTRLAVATRSLADAERRTPFPGVMIDRPVSLSVRTEAAQAANLVARIENLRDMPLEVWEIQVYEDPKSRTPTFGHAIDTGPLMDGVRTDPGHGPLEPHEVREELLREDTMNPSNVLPVVRLRLAIWSDLSYEGERAARDEVYSRRERQAETYDYWIAALTTAAGKSPADALAFLRDRQTEFAVTLPGRGDPMSGNLPVIARMVEEHPDTLAALLAGMRDHLERTRRVLMRHRRSG